jgi:hypothetical protein
VQRCLLRLDGDDGGGALSQGRPQLYAVLGPARRWSTWKLPTLASSGEDQTSSSLLRQTCRSVRAAQAYQSFGRGSRTASRSARSCLWSMLGTSAKASTSSSAGTNRRRLQRLGSPPLLTFGVTPILFPPSSPRRFLPPTPRVLFSITFRFILSIVAMSKLTVVSSQQTLTQAKRQNFDACRQNTEQCGASGQPAHLSLEHGHAQTSDHQVAGGERGEGTILGNVGSKQSRRGTDARLVEQRSHQPGWKVNDAR